MERTKSGTSSTSSQRKKGTSVKCEVEFLPVGEASKAGDAIIIRYGEPSDYDVMVVDGGMSDTGIEMAERLTKYFRRERGH
jgi:hypothetical protein